MKIFILILFSILVFFNSYFAQSSFVLTTPEGENVTNDTLFITSATAVEVTLEAHVYVENTNTTPLDVFVRKTETTVINGTMNTFCWGPNCYPPLTTESNPLTIPASSVEESFHGDYTPAGNEGQTIITYVFCNDKNTEDTSFVVVVFQAGTVDVQDLLSSSNFHFSKPYPNPALEYTNFEYAFEENKIAELRFYNVIGKEIEKILIYKNAGKILVNTSGFDPGIYFYLFSINSQVVNTGKLNIKK